MTEKTGVRLKLTVNDADVFLKKIQRRVNHLDDFWHSLGEFTLLTHTERFKAQETPDGTAWQPLSEKYLASKRKRQSPNPDKILVLDFVMAGELFYQFEKNALHFGTNQDYGAMHQFGDASRGVPAREWLGYSKTDLVEILHLLSDFLMQD